MNDIVTCNHCLLGTRGSFCIHCGHQPTTLEGESCNCPQCANPVPSGEEVEDFDPAIRVLTHAGLLSGVLADHIDWLKCVAPHVLGSCDATVSTQLMEQLAMLEGAYGRAFG